MERLQNWMKKAALTPQKLLVRFLSVFLAVNAVSLWGADASYTETAYINTVQLPLLLAVEIAGVLFLTAALLSAKTMKPDKTILFGAAVLFFCSILYRAEDIWLYTISCGVFAVIAFYCFYGDGPLRPKINRPFLIGAYAALAVVFTVFVGGLTALRYKMYIAPNFDFGIFAQMFDNMKETGIPYTTCERDTLLSHFNVHLSFIYYLILPFYYLFDTPYTLNIAQAVILASGVIPLYLLCRHHKLSDWVTLALGVVYVFYPALSAGCFYDIHENCFLTPLLLWLMVSIDRDSTVGLILSAGLICTVKEDAPIYLMFVALWMFFEKKKLLKPALLLGFAVAYFLVAVWYLDSHGDGAMLYRYANFSEEGGSIMDIVRACVTNPGYVFSQCLDAEKLEYALKILLPLGFLPLFCGRAHHYILLGPFMLMNLMSYYPYQHSLDFQYNFGTAALLFYLTIVNVSRLRADKKRILAAWCAAVAVFGAFSFVGGRMGYIGYYQATKETCAQIDEVIEAVPENASVYASTFILPHLYQNDVLYQLNASSPDLSGRTEYVVIDLRFDESAALYPTYASAGFQTVAYEEGAAAVLYCPFYTGEDTSAAEKADSAELQTQSMQAGAVS